MKKIYLAGYRGRSLADFSRSIASLHNPVVLDIRFQPYTNNEWKYNPDASFPWYRLGSWGNSNYKVPGHPIIVDYEKGLALFLKYMEKYDSIVLLCACNESYAGCHRNLIAAQVIESIGEEMIWERLPG